ncbi:MAG: ribonuclease III [Thermomicrobiales bacterium]
MDKPQVNESERKRRRARIRAAMDAGTTLDHVESPAIAATPARDATDVAAATYEEDLQRPERLAEALGLRVRNIELLRLALTHRSVVHEWSAAAPGQPSPQSNERLEFLGDAYLGVIVAEYLYNRYPDAPEGTLTHRRVALVRAERLVHWAREINLADYLYLAQGERVTEGARDRMLAGAFEALIAAITLDRGMREAKRFLRRFLDRDVAEVAAAEMSANPKGRLQELLQERFRLGPVYRTIQAEGPAHARVFTAEVTMAERSLGVGAGGSKRDAEQAAARAALALLVEEGIDEDDESTPREPADTAEV